MLEEGQRAAKALAVLSRLACVPTAGPHWLSRSHSTLCCQMRAADTCSCSSAADESACVQILPIPGSNGQYTLQIFSGRVTGSNCPQFLGATNCMFGTLAVTLAAYTPAIYSLQVRFTHAQAAETTALCSFCLAAAHNCVAAGESHHGKLQWALLDKSRRWLLLARKRLLTLCVRLQAWTFTPTTTCSASNVATIQSGVYAISNSALSGCASLLSGAPCPGTATSLVLADDNTGNQRIMVSYIPGTAGVRSPVPTLHAGACAHNASSTYAISNSALSGCASLLSGAPCPGTATSLVVADDNTGNQRIMVSYIPGTAGVRSPVTTLHAGACARPVTAEANKMPPLQ